MKKGFLKKVGIIVLASVVLLATGCQKEPDYKGAGYTDQQITLGTPNVRGTAYPGVNYIYWDRVANAINGYTLNIYEDGILTNKTPITLTANQTFYVDTDVKYDVKKTYRVTAIGDSAGRYVIYTESDAGSITLNPIVPPTDTPALDLAKYEKGYKVDAETPYTLSEEDAVYQLSANSIKVAKNDAQGTFTVTFPAKAYLSYTVYADYGKTYDLTGVHEYKVGTYQDFAVNNKNVTLSGIATIAGTYEIYVKASAFNTNYFNNSDDIKAKDGLTYKALALSSNYTATNVSFTYQNETTLDVSWQPAIFADGTYAKVPQYKIYKTVAGLTNYEEVTAAITVNNLYTSNVPTYKFTDTTNGASYKYLFVVTDGTAFAGIATNATAPAYKDSYSPATTSITAAYEDEKTVNIYWTPASIANGTYAPTTAYKVYRKIAGENDTTYAEIGTVQSTTTLFGSTTYYVNDTVTNNSVDYVYLVIYTDGITKTTATVTVKAYKITYSNANFTVNLYYTADDTVRIKWSPATIDGKMLATTAYEVYRRAFYGTTDADWTKLTESVLASKDQDNNTVYYVDTEVEDNSIAYYYTVRYRNASTIFYSTKSISAYSAAIVYSVPTVTLVAADDDNIFNDVRVTLTVSDEQEFESIKYLIRDTNVTTGLLAADYTEVLKLDDATVAENLDGNTYEWIISNLEEGSYVSVAAIVDGNAKYATTTAVTASEPAEQTATTNSTVSITWKAEDDDGIANDAYILVTLADDDKELYALTYGVADTSDEAAEIALSAEHSLEIDGAYKVYAFSIENAATETGKVLYVRATISEKGKKNNYITKESAYNLSLADSFSLYGNAVNTVASDDDGLFNDISFAITAANAETSFKVIYASADDADTAKKLLDSKEAKTLVKDLTGYTFYEFNAAKYDALKDLELGQFIAFRVTASQNNRVDRIADPYVSTVATYDSLVDDRTAAPNAGTATFKALDEDRIANDLYATFELSKNQKISKMYYTTATKAEYTASNTILSSRLNSVKVTDVTSKVTEKYHTDENVIYQITIKDIDIDNYIGVRYVISEEGKLDYIGTTSAGPVTANPVVITTTAAPVLSQSEIFFTSYGSDANYNDIKQDDIYLNLGIDQSISSIRYAYAETKEKINELLRTDSTAAEAKDLEIPSGYELLTSVSGTTATLTKQYYFVPYISNIPDGNMVGIKFVISEPGCGDYVRTIYTGASSYYYSSPVEETITSSAVAAQKPVRKARLTVDDTKNWEYVHVIVNDWFYNDSLNRYTYKLERTYEEWYDEPDAVWETVEESIDLTYNYSTGFYTFDKYYNDEDNVEVGTYVYRLTKTRDAEYSVTGEDEIAVTDARVSVVYHVVLDTLSFSDYSSEKLTLSLKEYMDPNYDHIDKYNYTITYNVDYYDAYGDYIYSYTDDSSEWTELTDWTWKEEMDSDGNETGYYLLTGAVINGINPNDPDVKSARVFVNAYKDRKIATLEYTNKSTEVLLNWGITASIAPSSSISLAAPYTYTSGDRITNVRFEADENYDSYTWYVDGVAQNETGNQLVVIVNSLASGTHEIIVVAKDGNIPYSATVTYTKD